MRVLKERRWSQVMNCSLFKAAARRGKIPLARKSRVGQQRRGQSLDFWLPWAAGLCAALNVSGPSVIHLPQSWCWMVPGRLATIRNFEAQDRREERLLVWKVREDEWFVATPDGQDVADELRSWVDAALVSSNRTHDRRVLGDMLQFSHGPSENACFLRARAIAHQDQMARGSSVGKDHNSWFDAFGTPMTVLSEGRDGLAGSLRQRFTGKGPALGKSQQPPSHCRASLATAMSTTGALLLAGEGYWRLLAKEHVGAKMGSEVVLGPGRRVSWQTGLPSLPVTEWPLWRKESRHPLQAGMFRNELEVMKLSADLLFCQSGIRDTVSTLEKIHLPRRRTRRRLEKRRTRRRR